MASGRNVGAGASRRALRDQRAARAGTDACLIESLEPRMLLDAAGLREGVEMLRWDRADVEVRSGSWLMSFDSMMPARDTELLAREALAALDITAKSITPIARGRHAMVELDKPIPFEHASWLIEQDTRLVGLAPDFVYKSAAVPNDPRLSEQWWVLNTGQFTPGSGLGVVGADIKLAEAWDKTTGSRNVVVAVIDTGVDIQHDDLVDNLWQHPDEVPGNGIDDDGNGFVDDVVGWDFGEGDNNPDDVEGHGTAVAGTIGAVGNNGIGAVGVNWAVSIMPIKIADRFGNLSNGAIVAAHDYLTMMIQRGYNIVASNNSYGAFLPSFYANQPTGIDPERDAIERFIKAGGTFVAAAGNSAINNDENIAAFPATYAIPGLISVAATDNTDGLASFSNFGPSTVDLGAPGQDTFTTFNGGGYGYISGTSFASPITAGVVGLIKALKPNASPVEVRDAIIDSTDPLPALQGRVVSGGRLNAARALQLVGQNGPLVRGFVPGPIAPTPVQTVQAVFSETIDPTFVSPSQVSLISGGPDGVVGNGDDQPVAVASVTLSSDGRTATITPASPLVVNQYRVTLQPGGFRDLQGNFLNGNGSVGAPAQYVFDSISVGANFEPNDTLQSATPVPFSATGEVRLTTTRIGDGPEGTKDVDLFRVDIPRGGLITIDIDAQNLNNPSSLDSYVRLFNASGQQLASNDQFDGKDSYLDFFVTTGGTYYVGVSGFPNTTYNPAIQGSGPAQSNGVYEITLRVDLVEDDTLIQASPTLGPIPIPDGTSRVIDSIFISDSRLVLDVDAVVSVNHDFAGDVRIKLRSPSGTETTLVDRRGGSGNYQANPGSPLPIRFDDEAGQPITSAATPYSGKQLRPEQPLSRFDGESAFGLWQLIVEDLVPLNAGQFLSWSMELKLENDIFGPFELNDTLSTARQLAINGSGSSSVQAVLGDGGFGNRDVDLFRFTAEAGGTVTATVDSLGQLDAALRLFNATGQEVKLSSPNDSNDASIQNFVISEGGIYYIAVTEAANLGFNPIAGGSGSSAQTTGSYSLDVQLASGVSDGQVALVGDSIELTVDSAGVIAGDGLSFGGIQFLSDALPTLSPLSYFGLVASGNGFRNDGSGGSVDLPMSVLGESTDSVNRVTTRGISRGVEVERSISFGDGDSFLAFDVRLTNRTSGLLTDVAWMEALNPQQGLSLVPQSGSTSNDVRGNDPYVSASYDTTEFPLGLTFSLGAPLADSRAFVTAVPVLNTTIRDPGNLIDFGVQDPNGTTEDRVLAVGFDVGQLDPGQSSTLRYYMFFGNSPAEAEAMYDQLNAGSAGGLLALDPRNPINDAQGLPDLPYRVFYPEGYANSRASTFVPIANPNQSAARVMVIARYETGVRDQILSDEIIPANSRGGITITTPDLYATGQLLVRPDTPYALEIRSELPVGATMSHYDFTGSTGESFTSQATTTWTFPEVRKGGTARDFVIFQNVADGATKVTTTFYRTGGGLPISIVTTLDALRRGGWNIADEPSIPSGTFAVVVESQLPIVAAVTSFDQGQAGGYGALGVPGVGTTTGALPQGLFGVSSASERVSLLNTTSIQANVALIFTFDNGSSYRRDLQVAASARTEIDVASLPGFPKGRPYSIEYTSTQPIAVSSPTRGFGDVLGSSFETRAAATWIFAEGFRPTDEALVDEYLRVFNPSSSDTLLEITMRFSDGQSEIYRRVAGARRVTEFDVHDFVSIARRDENQFFSFTVKASVPVVAYFGHSDQFFPGAFGTLGTPIGVRGTI